MAKKLSESIGIVEQNIAIAHDGSTAIEKATKQLFDVIIMDIRMININGIEASKRIKSHYNENPPKIIAYTADVFLDQEKDLQVFDAILYKPTSKEEFTKTLLDMMSNQDDKKIDEE